MKSDNIQKSVRMPPELVEYIEKQRGPDFSKKLVGLLMDIRKGDHERQKMLDDYDKLLADKRDRLSDLSHKIYDASEILRQLASILSYADSMME